MKKLMEFASPMTFEDEVFFSVLLAGDKKGSVALAEKSPAPWKDKNGEWNYWEDKNGNPKAVSVPYAGVMVLDPELGMMGLGSAVYSSKRTESSCSVGNSKKTTYTQKISLPVELAPIED